MKIVDIVTLIDTGAFSSTDEYKSLENDVKTAIESIVHPPGSGTFTIFGEKKGNGVTSIKNNFVETLNTLGWKDEHKADRSIKKYRIDATKHLQNGTYFGTEWETGNISSSHRALNRLVLCMQQNLLSGGILVLPSRALYQYLTDRVGNYEELEPYLPVWRTHSSILQNNVIKIFVIEHDFVSNDVPHLIKGTDGRAHK